MSPFTVGNSLKHQRKGAASRASGMRRAHADRLAAEARTKAMARRCRKCQQECWEYDSGSLVDSQNTRVRWTCRCGGDTWEIIPK